MKKMMRRPSIILVGMLLAAAFALAGCREDNSSNVNNANSTTTTNRTSTESNTRTTPTPTPIAQATPTQATATPVAGSADSLPVTNAVAFRDRLLELAKSASFDSQKRASENAYAIREAWEKQYPALKFSIFYSMAATPDTVSSSDTFLISGASGNFDQLYAFAVADTSGKCAGGAAVIPGDNQNRKVSDAKVPTVFKPIDMSNAKSCTGDAAGKNYKP